MRLKEDEIRLLCYFIFESIVIRNNEYEEFPKNLKFIFKLEDIKLFEQFIKERKEKNSFKVSDSYSYYIYDNDIENVISTLKSNLEEYTNNKNDNAYYIYVDDVLRFTNLISRLSKALDGEIDENGYELKYTILNAVWLRMSPNDFSDIYKFLEKQILFAENDNFNLVAESNYLNGFQINYKVETTGAWYETNKKMSITISSGLKNTLFLPEVYFQILEENNKKVCYLYAVQNPKYIDTKRRVSLENELLETKKQLRNKSANYKFILAIEIFIQILKENNIFDIKVPLLQLFNYDYHISMSENSKNRFAKILKRVENGNLTYDSLNYIFAKAEYDKVADKEDIISKNKTERLINIFMFIEEYYKDIEVLNLPFIEDENLIIKVLDNEKNKILEKI